VFEPLRIGEFSWYITDVDTQWTGKKPGDIDIVGGRLTLSQPSDFETTLARFKDQFPTADPWMHAYWALKSLAEDGAILWPPDMAYLLGVEVKCSYFENGKARSIKSSSQKRKDITEKVNGLLALGLDRVALLDIVATYPSEEEGSQAWLGAMGEAGSALAAASKFIAERLPIDSPAGQFVLPIGAVFGGDEASRGSAMPRMIRTPQQNPFAGDPAVRHARQALTDQLRQMLNNLPKPRTFPVCYEYGNCSRTSGGT
jgi:hypothetical protein